MFHRVSLVVVAAVVSLLAAAPAGSATTPRRIISLSPTATESLFAIGAGKQVVAVDDQSDYPKRAPRTSLSGYTPNVEAIAGYRPDLVVLSGDANDAVAGLRRLQIRVLVQPAAKTLTQTYAQIRQLGSITGHGKAAAKLVTNMKRSIARVLKATPKRRLSVYHELTPDYFSATSQTFIGRIYKLFGLRNIADAADSTASGFPQLSAEYIVASNPGLVVLADARCCGQSPAAVARRPGWNGIAAVRTGSVVAIDDSVASRWGPRVVQFVRAVGEDAEQAALMRLTAVQLWTAALAFLGVSLLAGVLVGPVDLGAVNVVRATLAHVFGLQSPLSGADDAILWELRLPRVILAALVGGTLAAAGAAYQGVFRNPLADPYLLGAAAGAGLGATLIAAYAPGSALTGDLLPIAAFVGASIAVVLAYVLGRSAGAAAGPAALVLAGVTIASFFTALQTFVQQQNVDTVQEVYSWLLGRLSTSGWREVGIMVPYAAAAWLIILGHRRLLDVLSVGDDEAAALGVNVARVRLLVVTAATIATAAAVAVSGLIAFVGIIVPHTIRLLIGGSYRTLLPLSVVVGAGFLVFADIIARTVMSPAELPIGVVTAFFGAPFFAVVLRTSRSRA